MYGSVMRPSERGDIFFSLTHAQYGEMVGYIALDEAENDQRLLLRLEDGLFVTSSFEDTVFSVRHDPGVFWGLKGTDGTMDWWGLKQDDVRWIIMATTLETLAKQELERGEPEFMGKPERWFEAMNFRCPNDHVSRFYIKSEEEGSLCPLCCGLLQLTFPEDVDGPLAYPRVVKEDQEEEADS